MLKAKAFLLWLLKVTRGTTVTVPELELSTHYEIRNFVTAIRRSKIRKEVQVKLQRDYDAFIPKEDFALLDENRCKVTFEKSE